MYRCVQQTTSVYLCELIQPKKKSGYVVRSYALDHLHVSDSGSKSYGDRAFYISGPTEWNKLPFDNKIGHICGNL